MLELNHKNYHLLLLFTCQVIAYNLLHYKLWDLLLCSDSCHRNKGMSGQSLIIGPTIKCCNSSTNLHALTYHKGPWRWACCPIWPLHCNDKKRRRGYAARPSSSALHLWTSVSQTLWISHTVTQTYTGRTDRPALNEISLRFWAYGPAREGEGESGKGRERGVERVGWGWGRMKGRLEPGTKAKQTTHNRAALCPRSLTHTPSTYWVSDSLNMHGEAGRCVTLTWLASTEVPRRSWFQASTWRQKKK